MQWAQNEVCCVWQHLPFLLHISTVICSLLAKLTFREREKKNNNWLERQDWFGLPGTRLTFLPNNRYHYREIDSERIESQAPLGCLAHLMGTLKPQSSVSITRWLEHWPLMLHLVHRGSWAGCGLAQAHPPCTKCNSSPINGQWVYQFHIIRCGTILVPPTTRNQTEN